MKHAVLKLGGSVLRGPRDAAAIAEIIDSYREPLIVVVSAFKGVTDLLAEAADRLILPGGSGAEGLASFAALAARLRDLHRGYARALGAPPAALEAASRRIDSILRGLLALFASEGNFGPSDRAELIAAGERLSATCVALALAALGRPAPVIEPAELGLIVSESPEGAEVDLAAAGPRMRAVLDCLRDAVVPGFYGVDASGRTALLGRGGSDYSAALIAAGIGARRCDLVKDVPGFLTADPSIVADARPVLELSYEEAESLAKGGAKLLHGSAVEPLREAGIPLRLVGASARGSATLIGPGRAARAGAKALALSAGPAGTASITVACGGRAAKSAALLIGVLESRGISVRSLSMGPASASFGLIIDRARGEEGLRIAHAALFASEAAGAASPARSLDAQPGVA
jgi:bifunctional aspartokinase / homoserine dehydrogenase 1